MRLLLWFFLVTFAYGDAELDVQSLLAFKRGVSHDPFHVLKNWHPGSSNACNWTGITCSTRHSHRVTELKLSDKGLGGSIAPEIGNLSFLHRLDLSINNFTRGLPAFIGRLHKLELFSVSDNSDLGGIIPSELGSLYSLIEFDASGTGLTGIIPPSLGNCSRLQGLFLDENNLRGTIPNTFGSLTHLIDLYLGSNSFTGNIPLPLFNCSKLLDLDLNSNGLSGSIPEQLGSLQHLDWLVLENNSFTGTIPASLGNCSRLQVLSLAENNLRGTIPNTFGSLTRLTNFSLGHNSLIGNIPLSLFNCSKLLDLDLRSNRLSGYISEQLGSLHHLDWLDLSDNSFTGTIPLSIGNNTALTILCLHLNHMNGNLPPSLGSLSELDILLLWSNNFTGAIPISWCNLTQLTTLDVHLNNLVGTVPLCLSSLPKLEWLEIASNKFVSGFKNPHKPIPILEAFSNSSKLATLILSDNLFQGTLPPVLPASLERLYISDNFITGQVHSNFGNLSKLTTLYLDDNYFEGRIPAEMGLMKSLQYLDMGSNYLEKNIPMEFTLLNQSLAYLSLTYNRLSGFIPTFIEQLTSLRGLDLSMNFYSGSIPRELGKCLNLEYLDLSSNQLANEIPPEVSNLINIHFFFNLSRNLLSGTVKGISLPMAEVIDLSHNYLSGEITLYMAGWLDAKTIDLSFNKFSGALPESLGKQLAGLQSINLSSNSFTGAIPESLYNLSSLGSLNFSNNNFNGNVNCSGAFRKLNSKSFIGNPLLCGKCFGLPVCKGEKHSYRISKKMLLLLIALIIVGVLGGSTLLYLFFTKKKTNQHERAVMMVDNQFMVVSEEEVIRATSNFSRSNLLGQGAQGSVYVGVLKGHPVAIKIFPSGQPSSLQKEGFIKECQTLGRVRHRNLIKIITVCCSQNITAIIMPLMPKGNLHNLLHENDSCNHLAPLSLQSRVRILKEIASALNYLHHHLTPPIVHCDVKPENILLDYDFTVKLSDFGIAKLLGNSDITITSIIRGSIGYIAPEFGTDGEVSVKGDVYSFGIILLEVVTGVKPIDPMFSGDMSLCSWVSMALEIEKGDMQSNPILKLSKGLECLEGDMSIVDKILRVGVACCSKLPKARPAMHEVEGFLASLFDVDSEERLRIGPGYLEAVLVSSLKPIQKTLESESSSTFG